MAKKDSVDTQVDDIQAKAGRLVEEEYQRYGVKSASRADSDAAHHAPPHTVTRTTRSPNNSPPATSRKTPQNTSQEEPSEKIESDDVDEKEDEYEKVHPIVNIINKFRQPKSATTKILEKKYTSPIGREGHGEEKLLRRMRGDERAKAVKDSRFLRFFSELFTR